MQVNNNTKRGLTRDFINLILSDMRNLQHKEDFIRNSVDYSGLEHENNHKKIDHLQAIIDTMHQLNLIINDYCVEQIEILRRAAIRHKVEEVDFIDKIDPRAAITKREAALFCERSESWLQKGDHKTHFENQKNGGVNVLSFVAYLKESKPFEYQIFMRNYKKEL